MAHKIVLDQNGINEIVTRLGAEISDSFRDLDKLPVVVGVLKGSLNFMMDLIKHIESPFYTDFIQISSYSGTGSIGVIKLVKDLSFNCTGRTVLIVEDVVDTGMSMSYLIKHIQTHNPEKILICSLFDKKPARKTNVNVDFVGKELVDNDFLIGYGLDYNELERNLPYVYAATKEDIAELDRIIEKKK